MASSELIMLAEQLYGFRGSAYLCHIPAHDFTPDGELSDAAEAGVCAAAKLVTMLLAGE
jgi:hypothetical protein